MGWTEAVGHSVCALEAFSWHSGKHFIMLHESIVGYWLLLSFGWRIPLTPLHKSCFTLFCYSFCSSAKIPGCLCSSISFVTLQACKAPYAPLSRYSGVCERHSLDHWSPQKAFVEEAKAPRTRQEKLETPISRAGIVEHPASSDLAQAALLPKI